MIPNRPPVSRLFLITFDVPGASGGDRRYRRVDRYLQIIGSMYKPAKQVRLVVTDAPPSAIEAGVRHRIGSGGGVMVLRVGAFSSVDIPDPGIRRRVRSLIRRYGRR
jgi:hypothetical protein